MIQYLHVRPLPPELWEWKVKIEKIARDCGLDFFETIFEVIDYDKMNEIAAYGGFPTRYPHWRFGMEYEQLSKSYSYGLSKIYELVINTDPCTAYLLEGNEMIDQKLVMAHVYGHCDFFKNNYYFSGTNRKMIDVMANHATRVRNYMDLHGPNQVEEFIDVCLSLENMIDRMRPYIRRTPAEPQKKRKEDLPDELVGEVVVPRLKAKEYMEDFVNPEAYLDSQKKKATEEAARQTRFPAHPERDVLWFLMEHAPLQKWQRNLLGMIREEAYYFAPQGMTKIMNEGWASYWHAHIMTRKVCDDSEIIDFADRHSGTMATSKGRLNPYKLGIELFRHIEDRWNKGQFGKEYDDCDDMAERAHWDRRLGLGRQKIFEVRRLYNDVTFLDEFLTPEFCQEQKLFTFQHNRKADEWQIATREFKEVKKKLLFQLTNMGQPVIEVEDANFENRGELLLRHLHEGIDLHDEYARETMSNLFKIWKRPVHVATRKGTKGMLLTHDGQKHTERAFEVA
ncbi:SpoVR family protein [Myxococcota bacterium]|jgi:stage V sporulation protein R|nr:SpoVR family protein [Myxococcota bacterium]